MRKKLVVLFLFLLPCALGFGSRKPTDYRPVLRTIYVHTYTLPAKYSAEVIKRCKLRDVPVWLACRLAMWESAWKQNAHHYNTNGTVDIGLYQLNSQYFNPPDVDPFDPVQNIRAGIDHLAYMLKSKPSIERAIAAYQMGVAGEKRGWKNIKSVVREVNFVCYEGVIEQTVYDFGIPAVAK